MEFFPPDLAKIHRAYGAGGVWKPGAFFQLIPMKLSQLMVASNDDLLKICKNDDFPVRSVKLRSIKGLRMMHFLPSPLGHH